MYPGTLTEKCYQTTDIRERHRHRYEFNNEYRDLLVGAGLTISGTSPDGTLLETIEITNHPFFLGVQYHPEFKSRPNRPHPVFREFLKAALVLQERSDQAEIRDQDTEETAEESTKRSARGR